MATVASLFKSHFELLSYTSRILPGMGGIEVRVSAASGSGTFSAPWPEYDVALVACQRAGVDVSEPPVPAGAPVPDVNWAAGLSDASPKALGRKAFQGSGGQAARWDHVHPVAAEQRRLALRKWRGALAGRSAANPARWVMIGDSVTEGAYGSPVEAVKAMLSHYNMGRSGIGWIGGAVTSPYAFRSHRFALTTGTPGADDDDPNRDVACGLANFSYRLGNGSILTLSAFTTYPTLGAATVHFTEIEFYWSKQNSPGVTLEFRVGGVLVYTADCHDGTLGVGEISSGHRWIHTLASDGRDYQGVTVKAVGGSAIFDGVYIADGDTVRVYNAGHAGETFQDRTTDNHFEALGRLDPDLITCGMGLNNYADGAAGIPDLMTAYYEGVQAACSDPSWVWLVPYRAQGRTWDPIRDAMIERADALGTEVVDMGLYVGDVTEANDTFDFGADGIHLTAAGGVAYARGAVEAVGETVVGPEATSIWNAGLGRWEVASALNGGSALQFYAAKSLTYPTMAISSLFGSPFIAFGSGAAAAAYTLVFSAVDGSVATAGGAWWKRALSTKTAGYTFALTDLGGDVVMNAAGSTSSNIPLQASVAWPDGSSFRFINRGAGTATLTCTSGTLIGKTSFAQGESATITRLASNVWQSGG